MPFDLKKLFETIRGGEFYLLDADQTKQITEELNRRAREGIITEEERNIARELKITIGTYRTISEAEKNIYSDIRRKISSHTLSFEEGRGVLTYLSELKKSSTITLDEENLIQEIIEDARRRTTEQLAKEEKTDTAKEEIEKSKASFAEDLKASMAARQKKRVSAGRAGQRRTLEPEGPFVPTTEQEQAIINLVEGGETLTPNEASYYNKILKPRIEEQAKKEREQLLEEFAKKRAAEIKEAREGSKRLEVYRSQYEEILEAAERKLKTELGIIRSVEPTEAEITRHREYTMEAIGQTFHVIPTIGERAQEAWSSIKEVITGEPPEITYGYFHTAEERHRLRQIGLIESIEEREKQVHTRSVELVQEILSSGIKREITSPDFEKLKGKVTAKVKQELELMNIGPESTEGLRHASYAQAALRTATKIVPTTGEKITSKLKETAASIETSLGIEREEIPSGISADIRHKFQMEADKGYRATAESLLEKITGIAAEEFKKELKHVVQSEITRQIRLEIVNRYGTFLPNFIVSKIDPGPRTPFELGSYLKGKITREIRGFIIKKIAGKLKDVALEVIEDAWKSVFPSGEELEEKEKTIVGGYEENKSSYIDEQRRKRRIEEEKRKKQELPLEQEESTKKTWETFSEGMREAYERMVGGKKMDTAPEAQGLTPAQIHEEQAVRRIERQLHQIGQTSITEAETSAKTGAQKAQEIKSSFGYAFGGRREELKDIKKSYYESLVTKMEGEALTGTTREEIRTQYRTAVQEVEKQGLERPLSIEKRAVEEKEYIEKMVDKQISTFSEIYDTEPSRLTISAFSTLEANEARIHALGQETEEDIGHTGIQALTQRAREFEGTQHANMQAIAKRVRAYRVYGQSPVEARRQGELPSAGQIISAESMRTVELANILRSELEKRLYKRSGATAALPPPATTLALMAPPPKPALAAPNVRAAIKTAAQIKTVTAPATRRAITLAEQQTLPAAEKTHLFLSPPQQKASIDTVPQQTAIAATAPKAMIEAPATRHAIEQQIHIELEKAQVLYLEEKVRPNISQVTESLHAIIEERPSIQTATKHVLQQHAIITPQEVTFHAPTIMAQAQITQTAALNQATTTTVPTIQQSQQLKRAAVHVIDIPIEETQPIESLATRATVTAATHFAVAPQFITTAQIEHAPRLQLATIRSIESTQSPTPTIDRETQRAPRIARGAEYRGPIEITIEEEGIEQRRITSGTRTTPTPHPAISSTTPIEEQSTAKKTGSVKQTGTLTSQVGTFISQADTEYTKTAEHLVRKLYPTPPEKAKPMQFDPVQDILGSSNWAEWIGKKVREGIDVFTQSDTRAEFARKVLDRVARATTSSNISRSSQGILAIEAAPPSTVPSSAQSTGTQSQKAKARQPHASSLGGFDVEMEDIAPDTIITYAGGTSQYDFSGYQSRLDRLLDRDRPIPPEHQAIIANDPEAQAFTREIAHIMPTARGTDKRPSITPQDRTRAAEVSDILSGRRGLARKGYRAVPAGTLPGEGETMVIPETTGGPGQRAVLITTEGPGRLAEPVGFGQETRPTARNIGIGVAKDIVVSAARSAIRRGMGSIFRGTGEVAAGTAGQVSTLTGETAATVGSEITTAGTAAAESGAAALEATGIEAGVMAGVEGVTEGISIAAAATSWIPIIGEIMMGVALAADIGSTIYGAVKGAKSQKEAERLQGRAKDIYWYGRSEEERKKKSSDGNIAIPAPRWSQSLSKFGGFGYGMTSDQRRSPGLYGL